MVCFALIATIFIVEKSSIAAEERRAPVPGHTFTINTLLAQSPPTRGDSVLCELGSLSGFSVRRLTSCHSAEIIEYPRDSGRRAARFEIKPNDPRISSGWHAELRDLKESVNGEETWYRISTLVPRSFPIAARHAVVLSQWHERVKKGHAGYRPPLSHRLIDGEFFVFLWNTEIQKAKDGEGRGKVLYRDPGFALGKFHEFVYRIVWLPECPSGKKLIRLNPL